MSEGSDQLQALQSAGYSGQEVESYRADRTASLLNGGFSQEDVAKYWGDKSFDTAPMKQYFQKNLATIKDQPNLSFGDYVDAGWQMSVSGLLKRQKMPDKLLPQDVPLWGSIAYKVAQTAGDFPAMLAGAYLGGESGATLGTPTGAAIGTVIEPGGGTAVGAAVGAAGGAVIGGGYGSNALPAYIRRVLIDAYTKGEVKDFQDFWSRSAAAFIDAHNAGMLGAVTAGTGSTVFSAAAPVMSPVAAKALKLGSEITAMTIAGKAMEGQVPTPRDFLEASIVVGGMTAAGYGVDVLKNQVGRVSQKLGKTYVQTGIRPNEIARDTETNPTIKQDILSDNIDLPRQYKASADPAAIPEEAKVSVDVPNAMRDTANAIKGFESEPNDVAIKRAPDNPIEQRFASQLNQDYGGAVKQYSELPDSQGGKVLNVDTARELSPDYLKDRTQSAAVHEPASAFIKKLYAQKLAEAPSPGEDNTVLFTGGGTGAGKSSAIKGALGDVVDRSQIVYDTNLNSIESSQTKIDQALAAGKDVKIAYVYRDPVEALTGGALPRAMRQETRYGTGRTVPLNSHLDTHAGSNEAIRAIAEHYSGNPRVQIDIIDNSRGLGQATTIPLESLPPLDYHGAREQAIQALEQEHQAGRISSSVYNGFAQGKDVGPGTGGESEPQRAQPGSDRLGGPPPIPPSGGPPSGEVPKTPQEQVLSRISMEEQAKGKGLTLDKVYTALVDDLHPLKQLTQLLAGERPLEVKDDPYFLARLTRGSTGKADHFLEYSPFEFDSLKNVGKPLTKILEPVRDDLDGLRAYAVSKRALELDARGIETGVPLEAAQQTVKEGAKVFEPIFKELQDYQTHTLEYLRDSGILSEEGFAQIKEENQNYVPFYRLMQEGETGQAGPGKGLSVRAPVKRIAGSERQIVDPLESIIKNTYLYVQLAERNRALTALADLAESAGDLGSEVMERVPTPQRPIRVSEPEVARFMKENGIEGNADAMTIFRPRLQALANDEIALYRDGNREVYRVDPDVATSIRALDRESVNLAVKIMAAPAKALRAGTTLSPEFTVRNFIRDQNTAFILNERGYIPIYDALKGLGSLFNKDADYQNWLKSGGANSAVVSMDRAYIEQNVFKLEGETGLMSKTWNVIKSPLEMLRVASEVIENGSRIGAYKRATLGEADTETILEGGMASRDVTLDFQRIGAKMRAANMIVAFLNPGVQGLTRTAESFYERPAATAFKSAVAITLPSVLLWYANKDDPRWNEVPRWQKDLFWIMFTEDHIYRIPKPPVLGQLFGSVPERILELYQKDNPKAFNDLSETMFQVLTPNYTPTFALPIIEQFANRSTFTGNPIVPSSMEGILPEYQYSDYTTESGKMLGKLVATMPGMKDNSLASPMVLENYIRAWSGQLGMYALKLADQALIKTGVVPDPVKPVATLADIPVIKAFVVRYPSAGAQSIQDFYDSYDKTQRRIDTIRYLAKTGDVKSAMDLLKVQQNENDLITLSGVKDALSTQTKFLRLVQKNPQMTNTEKRQIIDGVYNMMIASAQQGNKMIDGMNRQIDTRGLAIRMPPSTAPLKPEESPPIFGGGPELPTVH